MPARIPIETYPLYSLGAALNTENIKSIQKSQDDRHPPATCTSPCCSVSDWKSTSSAQAPVHWMGLVKIRPTVMYWYSKFNVTLVGWLGLGRLYPPGRCPFGKQRPYQSFPVSTAWMRALCYLCFSPALGFITYAQKLDTGIDPNEFLKQHCIQCHGEEKQKGIAVLTRSELILAAMTPLTIGRRFSICLTLAKCLPRKRPLRH